VSVLAINGGVPVRTSAFYKWPVFGVEDEKMLLEALHSGHWGLAGKFIPEFEAKFAQLHQAKHALCVSNGTIGLVVALKAEGIGFGDEVILPSYTFIATASAVMEVGAVPVCVDIDPYTCCIDAAMIEQAITPRTKAIMPVHVAGQPANLDAILAVAKRHSLVVIEDSAQAHGAEWKGRKVGAIGDMGSFSFQSSKNLSSGEGGILVTNDDELAHKSFSYLNSGRPHKDAVDFIPVVGQNFRITEFQAALLISQLTRFPEQCIAREDNALYLTELISDIDGVQAPGVDPGVTKHAWHLFMVRFNLEKFGGADLSRISEALVAEGIPMRKGYVPLYDSLVFTKGEASCIKTPCPECEKACNEILWISQNILLGSHQDMEDIAMALRKVSENVGELQ